MPTKFGHLHTRPTISSKGCRLVDKRLHSESTPFRACYASSTLALRILEPATATSIKLRTTALPSTPEEERWLLVDAYLASEKRHGQDLT